MLRFIKLYMPVLLLGALLPLAGLRAAPLRDLSGKPVTLEHYTGKGKWTIVMIWASDCLVCNKEAGHYDRFYLKHRDKDAELVGLSMDGQANKQAALDFIRQHKLHFTNILGEPQDVADLFYDATGENWVGTPTFLIYSPSGKLIVQQVGAVPVALLEDFLRQQAAKAKH